MNVPNHSELRSDQAAAAMRIGFLIQLLNHELSEMWVAPLMEMKDPDATVDELDELSTHLSNRFSDFARSQYAEVRESIVATISLAREIRKSWMQRTALLTRNELKQLVSEDSSAQELTRLQRRHLKTLRTILTNIVDTDLRLKTWFELGDELGKLIYQLVRGEIPIPKPSTELLSLKLILRKLKPYIRTQVEPLLPHPREYQSAIHLASELSDAYRGLQRLVECLAPMAIPFWNGRTIRLRDAEYPVRLQRNSVLPPILDEFQRRGWPPFISLPESVKGDVTQALSNFRQKNKVIDFSESGDQVSWHDPEA